MKTIRWILLFVIAWPVFVMVWWLKPETRPAFVQQVIDFVKQYPKQSTIAGIAFGLIGGIGNLAEGEFGPGVFGLVLAAGFAALLARLIAKDRAAAAAEIAERADAQHLAYLADDDFGVYGTRDRPLL
ncbi:hypothetical protein [Nocardia salmonicida]|uniref:hypothetical protein n=1 Tax=Nocardia salmonicida TaxID=53431 RepID=UPI0007A502B9|nr:hypothetical protein [Nocardia salmonicida]